MIKKMKIVVFSYFFLHFSALFLGKFHLIERLIYLVFYHFLRKGGSFRYFFHFLIFSCNNSSLPYGFLSLSIKNSNERIRKTTPVNQYTALKMTKNEKYKKKYTKLRKSRWSSLFFLQLA